MKNRIQNLVLLLLLSSLSISIQAQDESAFFAQINEEEQKSIDALVMYPEETRRAILEVSQHPALLIKMDKLQNQSSEAFQDLLSTYSRETQERIWDLTRYPDLIPQLVALGPDKKTQAKELIKSYPELIHDRAYDTYNKQYTTLAAIESLRLETEGAAQDILALYPTEASSAMQYLLDMPDVLSLLNEHLDLTILMGEVYQEYPDWLLAKADSLQQAIAARQTEELEDWKKTLAENPEAMEELQASAKDYASEYGYDDLYYTGDDIYVDYEEDEPNEVIVRHQYYYYNYPYWFNYPTWYNYPRWRPLPWWHVWGFHYRTSGAVVIVNLPSYHMLDWYFYSPQHHYYYPHLTAHFVNHYYHHRQYSRSSVTENVRRWQTRNKVILTDAYLNDKTKQVRRIKEFGKIETDRLNYNRKYPSRNLSQAEFVAKNKDNYREIKEIKQPTKAQEPARISEPRKDKIWIKEKEKARPQPQKPTVQPKPKPSWDNQRINKQKDSPKDQIQRDQQTIRKVEKARDYHNDRWTAPKPSVKTKTPTTRPQNRTKHPSIKQPSIKQPTKTPKTKVTKSRKN